jgi:hypothetical protein
VCLSLGDDPLRPPPSPAPFGAEVDDVVDRLDHVEVVFDHHHRVAGVDQTLQHLQQLADVLEVEPGGGLVEDVEGRPVERFPNSEASLIRWASPPDRVVAG